MLTHRHHRESSIVPEERQQVIAGCCEFLIQHGLTWYSSCDLDENFAFWRDFSQGLLRSAIRFLLRVTTYREGRSAKHDSSARRQTGSREFSGRCRQTSTGLLLAHARLADRTQRVSFGTSGHRGSSLRGTFNEAHVLAITQAICAYRSGQGISARFSSAKTRMRCRQQAFATALEVLAANGVETMIDARRRLHADARRLSCHPPAQPRPDVGPRGRDRDHAVAQSA